MVGLSGAEAVQRLAAPWVPIGGSEVDCHLGEGREGKGHAAAMRTNRQVRPEAEDVESPEVSLRKPIVGLIVE